MKFDIAIIDVNTSLKSMQLRDTVKNVIGLVGNAALVSFSTYFIYRGNQIVCHADAGDDDNVSVRRQIGAFEEVLLKERREESERKHRDAEAKHAARKLKADRVALELIFRDTAVKYAMVCSISMAYVSQGLTSRIVESSPNLDDKPFGTSVTKVFVLDTSETGYINSNCYHEGHKDYCIDYDAWKFFRMPKGTVELYSQSKYLFDCSDIHNLDDRMLHDYFMSSLIKYAFQHEIRVPIPNEKCLEFIEDVLGSLTSEQLEMINKGV